jgi:hypothetical protein
MAKNEYIMELLHAYKSEVDNFNDAIFTDKFEALAQDIVKLFAIPVVVHSKNKPKRVLGDFDIWYKPCTRCGYDTGKSTKPKDGNKTCWKCGNFVQRDYTDRALKK